MFAIGAYRVSPWRNNHSDTAKTIDLIGTDSPCSIRVCGRDAEFALEKGTGHEEAVRNRDGRGYRRHTHTHREKQSGGRDRERKRESAMHAAAAASSTAHEVAVNK